MMKKFIGTILDTVKKEGLEKSRNTIFKASYMRMPQLKKSLELRYGLITKIVKDFYEKCLKSTHSLYPLSGEVAFNPRFLLEKLGLNEDELKIIGTRKEQLCGSNVPSGFILETFWNSMIDILGRNVCYVKCYLHHHGPVFKTSRFEKGYREGIILTGTIASMMIALLRKGSKDKEIQKILKKVPLDIMRAERLTIDLKKDGARLLT
jgi:hypothetical protein